MKSTGPHNRLVMLSTVLLASLFFWNASEGFGQDMDCDGMSDSLEQALALKFAPEWRFHKKVEGISSRQNQTEIHYPQSVEGWFEAASASPGFKPRIKIQNGEQLAYIKIEDIGQLDALIDPISGCRLNDSGWAFKKNERRMNYGNPSMKMVDILPFMKGDSSGFPTYFTCRPDSLTGDVFLAFFLFFPFDYKGYNLPFKTGDHRGDWEGICMIIRCIDDLNSLDNVPDALIEYIFYSGHGHQKYLSFQTESYRATEYHHTQVFVSWGSHAMYPQAGEWHNYKSPGPNWYDDFFHGNGLIVKSWLRPLINVGEETQPLGIGWLNYRGVWGPDRTGQNSSPPSPPGKGFWHARLVGRIEWNRAIKNYKDFWESSPLLLD